MEVLNTSLGLTCNLELVYGVEDFDFSIIDSAGKEQPSFNRQERAKNKDSKSLISSYSMWKTKIITLN